MSLPLPPAVQYYHPFPRYATAMSSPLSLHLVGPRVLLQIQTIYTIQTKSNSRYGHHVVPGSCTYFMVCWGGGKNKLVYVCGGAVPIPQKKLIRTLEFGCAFSFEISFGIEQCDQDYVETIIDLRYGCARTYLHDLCDLSNMEDQIAKSKDQALMQEG
ncbi:hypothetical protein F2P56_012794 [Juglans regia]|uniref:Uncharacterized protein n=2 Tax=Juglans regia TaxID=51240 RepID=A0A834CUY1_JUGRE|nr:uncharacterized protein LOC108992645 isoform X1 [Juglans regia]KAF5464571.1 hypothetical protein F2P56_014642 [Juglans regia]KAF5468655.1 hypothetical protein F2P56_012794 [Juglans regia]